MNQQTLIVAMSADSYLILLCLLAHRWECGAGVLPSVAAVSHLLDLK